jgi:hypothetical protein
LFYLPVLDQLANERKKSYGSLPLSWHGFVTEPFVALGKPVLLALLPGALDQVWLAAVVYVALMAFAVRRLVRKQDHALLGHLVVPLHATFLGLTLLRVWYQERYGVFLLFHVIVLMALGALEAWTVLRPLRPLRLVAAAVAASLLAVGANHAVDQTADAPLEDMQTAAKIVRGSEVDAIFTNSQRPADLDYYLGKSRYTDLPKAGVQKVLCNWPAPFVFIEHNYGTKPPDTHCLRDRGALRIRVPQHTRGDLAVWFVLRS